MTRSNASMWCAASPSAAVSAILLWMSCRNKWKISPNAREYLEDTFQAVTISSQPSGNPCTLSIPTCRPGTSRNLLFPDQGESSCLAVSALPNTMQFFSEDLLVIAESRTLKLTADSRFSYPFPLMPLRIGSDVPANVSFPRVRPAGPIVLVVRHAPSFCGKLFRDPSRHPRGRVVEMKPPIVKRWRTGCYMLRIIALPLFRHPSH